MISNHRHNIDPVLIGAVVPPRITFMAKIELFDAPIFGHFVKWYGAFPVRRGGADRQALRESFDVLKRGDVLGLFPEGHRSRTRQLQEVQAGAAMIGLRSGVSIVPIALRGTEDVLNKLWRRPRIEVIIGEPFMLTDTKGSRQEMNVVADEMMRHVAELLPEQERGHYRVAVQA